MSMPTPDGIGVWPMPTLGIAWTWLVCKQAQLYNHVVAHRTRHLGEQTCLQHHVSVLGYGRDV